ncbi:MAG: hypothetical protein LBK29_02390 [Oscillospiraceae bacterium]|jgi:hypothetical protein|nr:hypothetical protein [Oscillospiraceae bacterium]
MNIEKFESQMTNAVKKLASAGIAAMLALTGTMAGASSPITDFRSITKESTWQAVKKKLGGYWAKTPKPVKVFGKIALFSIPVIIGGRILYVKSGYKLILDNNLKLTKMYLEIGNKNPLSELDRMLMALLLRIPYFTRFDHLEIDQFLEVFSIQEKLLRLNSDEDITGLINQLNRDILFYLVELFKIECQFTSEDIGRFEKEELSITKLLSFEGITQEETKNFNSLVFTLGAFEVQSLVSLRQSIQLIHKMAITPEKIGNFDFLVKKISELENKSLFEWIQRVGPIALNKLNELDGVDKVDYSKALQTWLSMFQNQN